jgi:2-keto-4-pentenoate hydratase/2-oxohepta-3-ene-1,7-dioic acid hydratase in catechol pathway
VTAPNPALALGTFELSGRVFPGLLVADQVADLTTVIGLPGRPGQVRDLLDRWEQTLPVLTALAERRGAQPDSTPLWYPLDQLHVRAPIEPRQVLQAGANYRTHVLEIAVRHTEVSDGRTEEQVRADAAAMMDRRAADGTPYIFIGLPSAIAGPYDDLVLPAGDGQHDWELELAAVIGRRCHRVSRDAALSYVAGWTIVNDITTRDLVFRQDMRELGTDWFRSKNAPGFLPTGPFIVPTSVLPNPGDLRVRLSLNDTVRQDESTKDMLFDVAAIVSAAAHTAVLLPGDLVLTGSPAGNGAHWRRFLRPGDVMTGSITGLGTQRVRCVPDEAGDRARR